MVQTDHKLYKFFYEKKMVYNLLIKSMGGERRGWEELACTSHVEEKK